LFTSWLDKVFYGDFKDNWDDALFRTQVLSYLDLQSRVLDVGAGAGIVDDMNFKGCCGEIVGVDLDSRVVTNPFLDRGVVSDIERMPFADDYFDVVFSDNVMEHVEHPYEVLCELTRVLKPGGYLLFKTPNRLHYMALIATLTPIGFHRWFNELRGRSYEDTFPTFYRLNSAESVKKYAGLAGMECIAMSLIEGRPEYLRFNPVAYLFGLIYERIVNSTPFMRSFRILLIAVLRKPGA
jgi:SAM-dependent methyltransferase